jgi:5'-3' exonuclease
MIANIMVQMGLNGGAVEVSMFKHMVLNSLRSYKQKYGKKYGELIIATDTGASWRKSAFPYYKANRKKDRDESTLDWESIFNGLSEIKNDLDKHFPYRIICVEGAEADDVIGTLCYKFGSDLPGGEPILILSGDKDFKQLQVFMNVEQYDPVRNRKLTENSPSEYLIEHIIKGDKGDGIPNILSADNCLVLGQRQGTMTAKRLASFKEQAKTGWSEIETQRNYMRNQQLIDLKYTPGSLSEDIIKSYESQTGKSRDKIFNYLIANRMKHLMEYIQDF